MSLNGQKVVVVGGSSGIGLATAMLVAARGGRPVILGRDRNKLKIAGEQVGANVETIVVDARERAALDQGFAEIGRSITW